MNSLSTKPLSQIHRHRLRLRLRLRHHRLSFSTASASASSPSPFSHSQRRSDEESRSVRVSVWWDFENCHPPSDANVFKIAHSITNALRISGIKGPLQITAFGDVYQLARSTQEALSSSGVTLTHVPRGGKNSADRSLLLDLMYWVSQNPPPAHLFLISGDRDFAGILHKLRMSNYNILLACRDSAPSVLCSASSIMWQWNALVKGESVAGRHFNQPPDGPYNSWYGHYKGALEDPFAVDEPPTHSKTAAISDSVAVSENKAVPESQLQPVPRDFMRKVSEIVNLFPDGISLSILGERLFSGKPSMDKNLYGHKNFSKLLLSKPNIVRLKAGANGQFLVLPAPRQASKPVESSTDGETEDSSMTTKHKVESNSREAEKAESVSDGENNDPAASPIVQAHGNSVSKRVEEKPLLSPPVNTDEKKKSGTILGKKGRNGQVKEGYKTSLEELPSRKISGAHVIENHIAPEGHKTSLEELPSRKESGAHVTENHIASVEIPDPKAEMGYFRKQWTKWFEKRETVSGEKTDGVPDKIQASIPQPSNFVTSHGAPDSHQSAADNKVTSVAKDDAATVDVDDGDKSDHSPSFFMKILGWFKSSSKGSDANVSNESIEKSNQVKTSKRDELLLMDSFWSDVEAFLNTYKGTKVIWSSKTREEIAQNLREEGPLVIKPLEESDLLHLIDLLISEKKWIEERPSSTSPFRVLLPTRSNGASARMNNSGRLRSIILSPSSQPEKLPEQQDKGKTSSGTTTKPCCKTKEEVLVDCRKLLDDMFKESPEGINIGKFKAKFVERYDYLLDFRKFGHAKLAHLLQAVPEVRVGLEYVHPKSAAAKEPAPEKFFQLEDESTSEDLRKAKYEENDSPWEELGPVDGSAPSRKKLNPIIKRVENDYESPLSDDDMSHSEGEALSSSTEEEHTKTRANKDDSSLLQILDSWYQNEDNKSDFPQKASDLGRSDTASGKQRPGKSYTFVVDPDEGCKDRLIDGILDNLKKSGDPRIPN